MPEQEQHQLVDQLLFKFGSILFPVVAALLDGSCTFFGNSLQVNHWYKIHLGVYTITDLSFLKQNVVIKQFSISEFRLKQAVREPYQ